MAALKKINNFRIRCNYTERDKEIFEDLTIYKTGNSLEFVMYPTDAYECELDIDYKIKPQTVLHQRVSGYGKKWVVSEKTTGMSWPGATGTTRKEAIENACETLNRVSEEKFWKVVEQTQLETRNATVVTDKIKSEKESNLGKIYGISDEGREIADRHNNEV